MKIFLFILYFAFFSGAEESFVQVPDSCIQKKSNPCLIKAKLNSTFIWQEIQFNLRKDSLIELVADSDVKRVEVINGYLKLKSTQPYKIFGYDVKTDSDQYVSAQQDFVEVLDISTFDLKTLTSENSRSSAQKIYVLQKSMFLNRRELVQYLSFFYSDPLLLKKELTQLASSYQNKLTSDSFQQAEFLKKTQAREIASIEFAEKQRIAEEQQQKIDRKRSRELFFMRTFKR